MGSSIKREINKIREHRTLFENISYLSVIQVFNLVIPLITLPYLIRVLGKETYGLVVFAQAVISYFTIIVSFGFNITASREVSIHRDDKEKLNEIVSSVLIIKSFLFVLSMLVLIILLSIFKRAQGFEILFIISMWTCLYEVIFPVWYYQGIEKMKYITYVNLISRTAFLVLIFIFISNQEDYMLVPILSGIGALIAGSVSLYIIFIKHKIRFRLYKPEILKHYLNNSVIMFVNNALVQLYVSTNKVIAGAFFGMADVAFYDLADKIISVFKIPQTIIGQAVFPKVSKDKNSDFVKKIFLRSIIFNIVLFGMAFLFAKPLVILLGGKELIDSVVIVRILALTIPFIAASNIFAIQLLFPFKQERIVFKIVGASLIFYLCAVIGLITIGQINLINLAVLIVIIEIIVALYSYISIKKIGLF